MLSEGSVVKLVSQGLETDSLGFESSHDPTSAIAQDELFNVSKPQLSYLKSEILTCKFVKIRRKRCKISVTQYTIYLLLHDYFLLISSASSSC